MAKTVSWRTPKRRLFSTPLPEETRTYKPISHKELAKATLKGIRDAGFSLEVEEYYSAKEGKVANARYTIREVKDEDMQLEIGWQNSYDKTLSVKFAIGTRIMICENGCVSGNFGAFSKKHMADIKTFAPEEMCEAILRAADIFRDMSLEKALMKGSIIGEKRQKELVGRLFFDNNMVGSTQLNIILRQFKHPEYDYGCPGSIWEIYQHVTHAMKELHPRLWMEAHIDVHNYFLDAQKEHVNYTVMKKHASYWRDVPKPVTKKAMIDVDQIDIVDMIAEVESENKE